MDKFRIHGGEAQRQELLVTVGSKPDGTLSSPEAIKFGALENGNSLTQKINDLQKSLQELLQRNMVPVPPIFSRVLESLKAEQVFTLPTQEEKTIQPEAELMAVPKLLTGGMDAAGEIDMDTAEAVLESIALVISILKGAEEAVSGRKTRSAELSSKIKTAKLREVTIIRRHITSGVPDQEILEHLGTYLPQILELRTTEEKIKEWKDQDVRLHTELAKLQEMAGQVGFLLAMDHMEMITAGLQKMNIELEKTFQTSQKVEDYLLRFRSAVEIVIESPRPEKKQQAAGSLNKRLYLALSLVSILGVGAPLGLLLLKKKDVDVSKQSSGDAAPALPTSPAAVLPGAPKTQENLGEKSEAPVTVNDYIARALLRLAISNKSATISFVNEQEAAKTRQILEQDPERFIREQGCWNVKALFSVDPDGSLIYENSGRSFTVRLPAQAVPGFLAGVQKSADGSSSQAREDLAASLKVLGENCKEVRQTREAENDFFSFVLRFVLADPRLHGMITIQKDNLKEAQPFLDAITKQDVGYLIRTTENSLLLNNDNPPFADGTVALFKGPLAVNIPPYVVEGLRQGYEKHLKECAIKGEPHRKLVQASQKVRHILAEKPMSAEGDIMAKKDFCIFLLSVFLDHGNQGSSTLRFLTSPELQTRFETRQLTPEEKSRLMIQLALQADSASLSFNASGLSYIDPANNVHLTIPVGDLAGIWLPAYENALLANPNSKKYPAFYKMLEVKSEAKQ